MRDRQTCIECGKKSPETETNYTLISAQFGWRLTRRRDDNGDFVVEWRCPECWRSHKKRTENDPPPSMVMPVRPPVDKAPSDKTGADKSGGEKAGGEKAAASAPGAARPSSRPSSRSPSKPPSSIPASSPPPRTKRT